MRAWIESYLPVSGAGLSLTEIGALTNRDPSTVGYWVQKHGLTANGKAKYAPRGGLTREQLEPLRRARRHLHAMDRRRLDRACRRSATGLRKYGLGTARSRQSVPRTRGRGRERSSVRPSHHGETRFILAGRCRTGARNANDGGRCPAPAREKRDLRRGARAGRARCAATTSIRGAPIPSSGSVPRRSSR